MAEFFETSEWVIVKDKCSHCNGKGACYTDNGYSCEACHRYNGISIGVVKTEKGLPCSVCGGSGWVVKKSKKIRDDVTLPNSRHTATIPRIFAQI